MGVSVYMFMLVMLISGSANTLLMKFQVVQMVPPGPGMGPQNFDHPFFQTWLMMLGELLCLFAFVIARGKCGLGLTSPSWVFAVPCMCDWTATTLVNGAYAFIPASVVQMTRGAIVIFTCAFSVIFLKKRQYAYHLVGVLFVAGGITLVALSTFMNPTAHGAASSGAGNYRMLGISLCISAQIFQASMLVYEEKILHQYTIAPLQCVGMEGLFGTFAGILLLSVLYPLGIENTPHAFYQMTHSMWLLAACIASIFSIAFFNYSGVTVTQKASAVARSTIDVSRTIIIWAVELAVGWNVFNWLQFGGFIMLALGTMLYNRILVIPFLDPYEATKLEDQKLLAKEKAKQISEGV